jgi:two-component system KDP operon response regulator KdpE
MTTGSTTPGPLVLVVEDDPGVRRFLMAGLPAHGIRVREALTAEAGLRDAAQYAPDLVLLDLGLPDLDGLEVTRRLRAWSRVPIVVISARGQEAQKVLAVQGDQVTRPGRSAQLTGEESKLATAVVE